MPERPKRRKNNKNKRKNNKNNRTDIADNNSSSSVSANVPLITDDITSDGLISDIEIKQNSDGLDKNEIKTEEICSEIKSYCENQKENNIDNDEKKLIPENKNKCEESLETYIVESPDQNTRHKSKFSNAFKSKSVDNDDSPTIVDVTDETNLQSLSDSALHIIDGDNIIISDAECDVQWQKIDDLADIDAVSNQDFVGGALSSSTVPLSIAECHQTKSLSPEEESSLRCYLNTLNLSTNQDYASTSEIKSEIEEVINNEIKYRLRKRGSADDVLLQRTIPLRSLAVIDEEGSSESSMTSRRQSSLIDKKSDNEELEDDVFESNTSFVNTLNNKKSSLKSQIIPQKCIRVDAKLKEPEITEARGSWTTKTVEKITGAEFVYLTDSSSSTSSIHDVNEDIENSEDSDRSIRIITPTIEVTDTEKLLTDLSKIETEKTNKINSNLVNNNEKTKVFVHSNNNCDVLDHEILVESTENIKTDLTVKDIDEENETNGVFSIESSIKRSPKAVDKYDLEIKVLKCELNDAINHLIKEVSSDSESVKDSSSDLLSRQDSSSSVGSSQCTAKYNPTHSSLNDVSNLIHDSHDNAHEPSSHVKEVLEHVPKTSLQSVNNLYNSNIQPLSLRDTCLQKISILPYGDKIIEELAQVSTRLQNLSTLSHNLTNISNSSRIIEGCKRYQDETPRKCVPSILQSNISPPPLLPRKSSLKKTQDENRPIVPPKPGPIHKCLSPSQKILMEKTDTDKIKEQAKKGDRTNTYKNEMINENVDVSSSNISKNLPFKSQTGSRLLSLICDSSLNNNISSSLLKSFNNKTLDQIQTNKSKDIESYTRCGPRPGYSLPKHLTTASKHSIFPTSFYESDDSSEFTATFYKNIEKERKMFHYSTGNLNSDIENDISSIQNMHRYYTHKRDENQKDIRPRRPSLPKDLCDQQMEYIRQKEKEVDAEIRRLEQEKLNNINKKGPRAPMIQECENFTQLKFDSQSHADIFHKASKSSTKPSLIFSSSEEELLREKMYSEYVNQMAEREFRKEHKIIKITKPLSTIKNKMVSQSMPILDILDSKVNNRIEREFITKARERWDKLGIKDTETEDEQEIGCDLYSEPKVIEHKIKVIEAGEEKDVNKLPNHLQDFVKFTAVGKEQKTDGTGESEPEKRPAHVVILCAVIILMLTIGRYFLRLIRNKH